MVILDVSIVNVALPSISADLGFTPATLAWVVNAYTLAFAGFLLLGGRAADLLGRREVFAGGLALFALASLAGGLAQSEQALVAARAAQGLGGAIVAPATLSILTTASARAPSATGRSGSGARWARSAARRARCSAGVLTETLDWRWILIINVPIGLLGALAALRVVRAGAARRGRRRAHFDLAGALTVTLGLVVLTYGIVETEQHGWGSARTLLTLAAGAALLAVVRARRGAARARARSCRCGSSPRALLSGANVVVFCLGGAVFAMWYFLSLYLQQVLGYSPIEAGVGVPADADHDRRLHAGGDAADRPPRPGPGARGRDGADRDRDAAVRAARRRRPLAADVLVPALLCVGRDRVLVRPGDDRGDRRRARARRPGSRPGSSTRRARWAARSASRCSPTVATQRTAGAGRRRARAPRRSRRASTARSRSAPASR